MSERAVGFCDWLRGFFEITAAGSDKEEIKLKPDQVKLVRDKLNEVYPVPASAKKAEGE